MRHCCIIFFCALTLCAGPTGCAPGGGGSGGGGGGQGGSPPEPDAGCEPAAGEYIVTWTLVDEESDEECSPIEPSLNRFGDSDSDSDSDCSADCTCSRSITEDGDSCVATLFDECTDDDEVTVVRGCALGVSAGATSFGGRCGIELSDDESVFLACVYDVGFTRSGD